MYKHILFHSKNKFICEHFAKSFGKIIQLPSLGVILMDTDYYSASACKKKIMHLNYQLSWD